MLHLSATCQLVVYLISLFFSRLLSLPPASLPYLCVAGATAVALWFRADDTDNAYAGTSNHSLSNELESK